MIKDKLFLLSKTEVEKYLPDMESRICLFEGERWWCWLRSPGDITGRTAYVLHNGYLNRNGNYVGDYNYAVRPALHLNLSYFQSMGRTEEVYVEFGNRKWLVLDEETGLLLAKNVVCLQRFDENSNNYEQSEIREYLNGKLFNELFTREEQEIIMDTVIDEEISYPTI